MNVDIWPLINVHERLWTFMHFRIDYAYTRTSKFGLTKRKLSAKTNSLIALSVASAYTHLVQVENFLQLKSTKLMQMLTVKNQFCYSNLHKKRFSWLDKMTFCVSKKLFFKKNTKQFRLFFLNYFRTICGLFLEILRREYQSIVFWLRFVNIESAIVVGFHHPPRATCGGVGSQRKFWTRVLTVVLGPYRLGSNFKVQWFQKSKTQSFSSSE